MNRYGLLSCSALLGTRLAQRLPLNRRGSILGQLYRDHPDSAPCASLKPMPRWGRKTLALQVAEQAIALLPSAKDAVYGPAQEENLAFIQTIFGENSRAISTLTRLLQTPCASWLYGPGPIAPALLRLDPVWDPLRSDPAFQKLCEEKQP